LAFSKLAVDEDNSMFNSLDSLDMKMKNGIKKLNAQQTISVEMPQCNARGKIQVLKDGIVKYINNENIFK